MTPEARLIREIQIAATATGARLFRNNTGMAWTGTIRHVGNTVAIDNPRPLHAGLCVGSSDLIGWTADGRFLAIEVKAGRTRATTEQRRFIAAVIAAGGRAGIARAVADALKILQAVEVDND